jgi:NADH-quinone oxidoreductase subunit J
VIGQALLWFFAAGALAGGVAMLVLRHPMHVALSLIGTMLSLAGIYAALGVHVVAVFQVLIYVGAVMVFMVYAIMLLDVRDTSFTSRYSGLLIPGVAGLALFIGALVYVLRREGPVGDIAPGATAFRVERFSVDFLHEYWLHFELTSVLLLAAVVAAIAILKAKRRGDG